MNDVKFAVRYLNIIKNLVHIIPLCAPSQESNRITRKSA